ncbi:(2Fe-2S)-binding protein [Domibacillus antri]|uniref:(2Fe-2S)-binding protein n=1 Tax=Domibacillus antri TaxID=1714264 RepID=A0A1Q8Q4G6_9BACI|nr:Rieske 2Fe-2S domain-containing protein [Domibacillus antri]OLN22244.1 (2Fe-2S)-binding protein [Domibacillus antri]
MLSKENNEKLTRTGPDTPMGKLFRRYWIPAMISTELPKPNCTPVKIKLLGEELLAFRDTDGKVGLIDEFCPHRKVSLYFGRNEECGIRCVYHGWKFDVNGDCVDMPSEPPSSNFKDKVKIKSYPCRERGGVIWTYMGPEELMPELPELEWNLVPDSHRYMTRKIQYNNYFQAIEGGLDSSHISFLHRGAGGQGFMGLKKTAGSQVANYLTQDTAPKFEVEKMDYGMLVGANRHAEKGSLYWRITQFLMPWYTMIPPYEDTPRGAHAWVPMDDENVYTWNINWNPARPLTDHEIDVLKSGRGIHMELIPGTLRAKQNKENDYLIDRELQASGQSFTGIHGIQAQDSAVQETQGLIADRTQERLGSSDAAIIAARRMMLKAAQDLEEGKTPPALSPETHRVRSASVVLPEGVPFQIGAKDVLALTEEDYIRDAESNKEPVQNKAESMQDVK